MPVVPLTSFSWQTDPVPLAGLAIRVDGLAHRLGAPIVTWLEEGLGAGRGFGCKLPSGRACFLAELELAVQYQGARGPTVYVDASELGSLGADSMVAEVLSALELAKSDLAWVASVDAEQSAADLAASILMSRQLGMS